MLHSFKNRIHSYKLEGYEEEKKGRGEVTFRGAMVGHTFQGTNSNMWLTHAHIAHT